MTEGGRSHLLSHPYSRESCLKFEVRRLPLGILVDSLPFARAGAQAVTVSRLDWADLGRLHTARDSAEDLGLATATAVGEALAQLR